MKDTRQSFIPQYVQTYAEDGLVPLGSYRYNIRSLHTSFVLRAAEFLPENNVLESSAQSVGSEDNTLLWAYRKALVSFHSG